MRQTCQRYVLLLLLFISHTMAAQRVLYSPVIEGRSVERFSVVGKTGDYYWVQKERRKKHVPQRAEEWMKEEQLFDVYDARLQLLQTVQAAPVTASTLKKYLICGNRFFDEMVLSSYKNKTLVQLRRYTAEGMLLTDSAITSFPFNEPGNSFLLTVSADKTKILLLGFEYVTSLPPRLHAVIFNDNWKIISSNVIEHAFITQPFIQDDFFSFPSAASNAPVQLANNGEWLMASPSRTNYNFLLFHFNGSTNAVSYKEIVLSPSYKMEDIALSVNNEKGEAIAGILSSYHQTAHKNVHVTHYSFVQEIFDFDSSYRFSTLAGNQSKNNNLEKESFIAVPDMGFMLLKEYGRPFDKWYGQNNYGRSWDAAFLLANNNNSNTPVRFPINANGYSRYSNSGAVSDNYGRGDLSLFYFPGRPVDSCWSGFINKKQITELNAPALSYLFVPLQDKLVLMYNSVERDDYPFGTTLLLDPQGNQLAEREVISWKSDQSLLFQQSLQITKNEVAVPYSRNQQKGFAIFRF
ncbi:MAG: hypothetical protein ABIR15_04090 [Chitinophagaceae bacterium]